MILLVGESCGAKKKAAVRMNAREKESSWFLVKSCKFLWGSGEQRRYVANGICDDIL